MVGTGKGWALPAEAQSHQSLPTTATTARVASPEKTVPLSAWTVDMVSQWATDSLQLAPSDVRVLVEENVRGQSLGLVSVADLRSCGMSLGAAVEVVAAAASLVETQRRANNDLTSPAVTDCPQLDPTSYAIGVSWLSARQSYFGDTNVETVCSYIDLNSDSLPDYGKLAIHSGRKQHLRSIYANLEALS